MKHALTTSVVMIAMLFLIVPASRATSWCSKGPDEQPDHPCDDDSDAVEAAAVKFGAQWQSISGVIGVYAVQSDQGDYVELKVIADPPSLVPSVRAVLPAEADGFPVEVEAQPHPSFLLPAGGEYGEARPSESATGDEESKSDRLSEALLDEETQSWMDLPGVLDIRAARCGQSDCDPPKIAVEVQPAMMASVKEQIPSSKCGVPIVFVPRGSTPD